MKEENKPNLEKDIKLMKKLDTLFSYTGNFKVPEKYLVIAKNRGIMGIKEELQYIQNESEWILQSVKKIRRLINKENESYCLLKVLSKELITQIKHHKEENNKEAVSSLKYMRGLI